MNLYLAEYSGSEKKWTEVPLFFFEIINSQLQMQQTLGLLPGQMSKPYSKSK